MAEERRASVQSFFDANAQSWRDRYRNHDFDSISYRDRMTEGLHWLQHHVPRGARVLDAGCGAGEQAAALRALGYDVFACDLAPAMASLTREQVGARVSVNTVEALPYHTGTFDAAVMLGVLGYSSAPDHALKEMRRVLKPNGTLVISTAATQLLFDRLSQRLSRWPDAAYQYLKGSKRTPNATSDPGFYVQHYTYRRAPEFDALLARHGFRRLNGSAVNFGRVRFMGKALWPESVDVALTRVISRLSRENAALCAHARIYVGCYRKAPM